MFPFTEGTLYQVYAAPGQVTDIALQEGEQLTGPVAAGDTVRWIIGDTAMADLKLGPLPKQRRVRITIVLWEPLKEELDAYAVEHSRL